MVWWQAVLLLVGAVLFVAVVVVAVNAHDFLQYSAKWFEKAGETLADHPVPKVWIADNYAKRPDIDMPPDDFAARCLRARADELERRRAAAEAREVARDAAEVRLEAEQETEGL